MSEPVNCKRTSTGITVCNAVSHIMHCAHRGAQCWQCGAVAVSAAAECAEAALLKAAALSVVCVVGRLSVDIKILT